MTTKKEEKKSVINFNWLLSLTSGPLLDTFKVRAPLIWTVPPKLPILGTATPFSQQPLHCAALVITISKVGTNSIVCTALSFESVRVVWMYDWSDVEEEGKDDFYFYYVVSWFTVEEIHPDDHDFREVVDYQYNNEVIR